MPLIAWVAIAVVGALTVVAALDATQRRHSLRRNFPLVSRVRWIVERAGPPVRQYLVASDTEERPFTRDQRRWVYASAKQQTNQFGFGTDHDLDTEQGLVLFKNAAITHEPPPPGHSWGPPGYRQDCLVEIGAARGRARPHRPNGLVWVSGMSWGALSGPAVQAINRGCAIAGALHNTGEGGLSDHHRHGGELIFQVGTGYYGCRDRHGRFSVDRLAEVCASAPVRLVEIKLSQGAKPGLGGRLPARKVTAEIARVRGVPAGVDCVAPEAHTAFRDPDGLLELVEQVAQATGLPVGVKTAVGQTAFLEQLARRAAATGRGPDFVVIDGAEGGTGAAPLAFADHVGLPLMQALPRALRVFAQAGLGDSTCIVASGKLGLPDRAAMAFAIGCDMVAVAREAMLAIGCVQAQRCHTDHCPSGVATQRRWLMRGLDPADKAARTANYLTALRAELSALARAMGRPHPGLLEPSLVELVSGAHRTVGLEDIAAYPPGVPDRAGMRARACRRLLRAG